MVRYRSGRAIMTLGAPVPSLPAPILSKNRARYNEILPGVDLVLAADADTFRQTVIVKTQAAAADPRVKTLRFASTLEGATFQTRASGGFAAVEPTGITAFESPQPIMWDSTPTTDLAVASGGSTTATAASSSTTAIAATVTDPAIELQPSDGSQVAPVSAAATATDVTLSPNVAGLGAQVTYPVYIDPTWAPSRTGWAMVSSKYPTTKYWRFGGDEGMGYYNGSQGLMRKRLFYLFATGGLAGAKIKRARFTAFETHSNSCTASDVQVHRTTDISPNTSWNAQPSFSSYPESKRTVAYGRDGCYPGGHDVEFDVTAAVAYSTGRSLPNTTFMLRASNESASSGWKRFTGGATLSVDYNRLPTKPAGVSMLNPGKGCGAAFPTTDVPDLRVVPSDPDRENLTTFFEIYSGTTRVGSTPSVTVRSGTWAAVSIPRNADGTFLQGAKTYTWRAVARDASGDWSPYTDLCTFILDNPAVAPPHLNVTDASGLPLPPQVVVGAPVKVNIGPGGGTNITSYRWSVNNAVLDRTWTPPAAGTSPTYPQVTLTGVGTSTFRLQSVSRAGTSSAVVMQDVQVVPAGVQERNRWRLNEPLAATAAVDSPLPSAAGATSPLALSGTAVSFTGLGNGSTAKDDPRAGSLSCKAGASVASGAQNLVDPTKPWTVTGWVRPGPATTDQTVIAEDGFSRPVFAVMTRLVSRTNPELGTVEQVRFFALQVDNGSAPASVTAETVPVVPGDWYKVSVSYDAASKRYTLLIGAAGHLTSSVDLSISSPPTSGKTVRLCSAWTGEVDNVVNIPSLLSRTDIEGRLEQGQ